ncbi:hypothetical protein ACK4RO_20100, partial [Proteus mirabilis]
VDEVLPEQPMRQWVLSFPFQLRFLFASRPEIMGWVLGIVYRVIATHCQQQSNSDPPQQFKSDPLLLGFIH